MVRVLALGARSQRCKSSHPDKNIVTVKKIIVKDLIFPNHQGTHGRRFTITYLKVTPEEEKRMQDAINKVIANAIIRNGRA